LQKQEKNIKMVVKNIYFKLFDLSEN